MAALFVYMTCGDAVEAHRIAEVLLAEKLVACANIFQPHAAVYAWEGEVKSEQEVAIILKTTQERYEAAEKRIVELHSYDTPCIAAWPIDRGYAPFLEWVDTETVS